MVVLQVIDLPLMKCVFIEVAEQSLQMVRKLSGKSYQSTDIDVPNDELEYAFGGDIIKGRVPELLGKKVDSPIGCTEFHMFWLVY
jgi:hypothetical protein